MSLPDSWMLPDNTVTVTKINTEKEKIEGFKHDDDKSPLHLVPMDVMFEIADIMKHGAEKYPERNWERGMDWHRPFRACMSHLIKWFWKIDDGYGPGIDESGHSHLYHAACNILFLCAYQKRNVGNDNRP